MVYNAIEFSLNVKLGHITNLLNKVNAIQTDGSQ